MAPGNGMGREGISFFFLQILYAVEISPQIAMALNIIMSSSRRIDFARNKPTIRNATRPLRLFIVWFFCSSSSRHALLTRRRRRWLFKRIKRKERKTHRRDLERTTKFHFAPIDRYLNRRLALLSSGGAQTFAESLLDWSWKYLTKEEQSGSKWELMLRLEEKVRV